MKVKVTKVMAKHIAKVLKEREIKVEEVSMQLVSERFYALNIGTSALADADEYGDYDLIEDRYRVIRVVYPYEYYAMPTYFSTKSLMDIRRQVGDDIERFNDRIAEACEI